MTGTFQKVSKSACRSMSSNSNSAITTPERGHLRSDDPGMLRPKNYGAAWAFAGLVALVAIGFSFFDLPHCYDNKNACHDQQRSSSINDYLSPNFVRIGGWAANNHDAVEALSSIGVLIFTVVLAFATSGLWVATINLAKSTAKLSEAEKANSVELRKASDLAQRQLLVAAEQVDVQKKQHELSRLQFYAAHRPRIVIRSLVMRQFEIGKDVIVDMVLANTGTSEAQIVEGNVTIAIPREGILPPTPRYDGDRLFLLNMIFLGGHKNPIVKTRGIPFQASEWDCVESPPFGGRLFLFGFFTYQDGVGNRRDVGFGRVFDRSVRRFRVYDDQNYEYAD
jgi:hypothetical protein